MPKIFTKWLSKYGHSFGPFINGECSQSENVAPAESESIYKEISVIINEDLINESIRSGKNAFLKWKDNSKRGDILRNVCDALKDESELFAEISFTTHGISPSYSTEKDLSFAVNCFSYYANWANVLNVSYGDWQPYGVTAGILLDDNSPLMMLSCLVANALAAGNTIVLLVKPHYSLISLAFALTLTEAGIPPGVVNVLPCVDEESFPVIATKFSRLAGVICSNIKTIPSTITLSAVTSNIHSTVPMLVLSSADLESCISCVMDIVKSPTLVPWYTSIIILEEPVFERFVTQLQMSVASNNKFQEYKNEHEPHFQYEQFAQRKQIQGCEVLKLFKDYVCCLFLINSDDAIQQSIIQDNAYPPVRVISVVSVRTVDEAISKANTKNCGLAASVWTNDSVQSTTVPFMLQYGTVWLNSYGHFDSSVPFSSWMPNDHGSFSGKRALFENLSIKHIDSVTDKKQNLYKSTANEAFPKKDVNNAINSAYNGFDVWNKLEPNRRAYYLRMIATQLSKLWDSHYKMVLMETSPEMWERSIKYLSFWSNYTNEKMYDKVSFVKDFTVICKAEAIGVIFILAGSTPLDILMYIISAALIYGNTVVVGISSDENSAILAMELENIFSLLCGRINIIVNDTNTLWDQFTSNEKCSTIWYVKNYLQYIPKMVKIKNIIQIVPHHRSMEIYLDVFEIYCTKQKCIWLPRL